MIRVRRNFLLFKKKKVFQSEIGSLQKLKKSFLSFFKNDFATRQFTRTYKLE